MKPRSHHQQPHMNIDHRITLHLLKMQPVKNIHNVHTKTNISYLRGQIHHPGIQNQGDSSGQIARFAGLGSGWWRDAKALIKPGM